MMNRDSQNTPSRFNSGDAVQIGTGMGMVLMMTGARLIDALIVGTTIGLTAFGIVTIIRTIRR